jgi:parvulin-like peptidyl-prolyl isomerase
MTRTRLSLATLLSVAALVAAGCGGGSDSGSSSSGSSADVVAKVAGQKITRAELDDLMTTAELTYKQNKRAFPKAGTSEYQALQQQAAVFLVTRAEYEQEAGRRGITVTDADVTKALDQLIKDKFGGSQKKFNDYLKTTGYTLGQFRTGEERALIDQGLSKSVTKGITVTDADVKAYYEAHKDAAPYSTPDQRRVRHILIALNAKGAGVSAKGVTDTKVDFAKSRKLADQLYAKLQQGADFKTLVNKYSQDPGSKEKGGEYTDVKGTFAKEFEAAAFTLKTNEVSKPVKSQFGYHLIEALAPTKAGKTQTLAEARTSIRSLLLQQKQQAALQVWGTALGKRYKGKITYSAGYEPPSSTVTTGGATTTSP